MFAEDEILGGDEAANVDVDEDFDEDEADAMAFLNELNTKKKPAAASTTAT